MNFLRIFYTDVLFRKVYYWFYWVYRICAGAAIVGYALFMFDFIGISKAITGLFLSEVSYRFYVEF